MTNTIGVLGSGWLGFPLALALIKEGYTLRGTSTNTAKLDLLKNRGIESFHITLHQNQITGPIDPFLDKLDLLVINIPPGMRKKPPASYFKKIELLYHRVKENRVTKIIFVSSTSVYGKIKGEVTEEEPLAPLTDSAKHLVKSEKLFFEDDQLESTIIRFGGLIGPDRHPVFRLSGKTGLKNGNEVVNLIHLDDCIYLIKSIIQNNWWNEIFNGVYPDHPTKADYYTHEAQKRGIEKPHFETTNEPGGGKIVICENFLIKNHRFYTSIHS